MPAALLREFSDGFDENLRQFPLPKVSNGF